jgi:hypothetical protein
MPHKGERRLNGIEEKNEIRTSKLQGALAMLGFAKRFRPTRTTEEWIAELREADLESND